MEIRNFFVEDCKLKGFYKEVLWVEKEKSFYLSVVSCLFDFLLRFNGKQEVNSIANAVEYDLNTASKSVFDPKSVAVRSKIDVLLDGYNELKNFGNYGNLEFFYKKLEEDIEFVDEMAEWSRAALVKLKVIKNHIYIDEIHQVLNYFYKRYKIFIVIYKDGGWVSGKFEGGFAIFCPLAYGDGFSRLLTEDVYRDLKVGMTELKFPYIFRVDWESILERAVNEPINSEEDSDKNEKLLKLLNQIILQVPLDHEEETQILSEYSKSGIFSKELELLKLRNSIQSNPLNPAANFTSQCDVCKSTCSSQILISCKSHCLCIACRLSSFSSTYSSTCSICARPLTANELTILNSYI